ncbi:MAG TPA: hypothetical protein VMU17_05795, partial [Elusimicrobiota bacterium]|nr:hypothetical protein [Elusimicrobiota bacterium]
MSTIAHPGVSTPSAHLSPPPSKGIQTFAVGLAALTFLLVIAGGLVTSTGSALAVPDWPLSFGRVFPPMVGGVLYEHGHRLVASAAGFLTVALALWLKFSAAPTVLRRAAWIGVGLVVLQGVLGGVTVLLKLPAVTSVAHACLGQIYFAWMVCIAVFSLYPQALVPSR